MVKPGDLIGASCPEGGTFYVCESTGFLGCCTQNPCQTYFGTCDDKNLKPTSFDADKYDMIPPQRCFGTETRVQWYTCTGTKPYPFMGCCDVNPCSEGSCPDDKVRRSKLSSNKEDAQVFLGKDTSTTTPTTTSTRVTSTGSVASTFVSTSTTSSETAASTTAATTSSSSNDDGGLSQGAVIGIAVGATAAGMLAICLFIFWFWRRARRSREQADASNGPLMGYSAAGSHQSHDSAKHQSQRTSNTASFGITSPGSGNYALPNSPQPYYDRASYQSGVAPSPEFRSQHGSPPQQWAGSPPTGRHGYLVAGGMYGNHGSPPGHVGGFQSIAREETIAELPAEAVRHGSQVSGVSELPTNSNTVSLQSYNGMGRESEVSGTSDNRGHVHGM